MFYKYKVNYWCDFEDKEKTDEGLVYGFDYGEAANNLKKGYGNNLIDMYLLELDADYIISVNDLKATFK